MNWAAIIWLALMIAFLAAESASVSLVSIWFAVGSLVALFISLFGGPLWLQGVAFLAVSCLTLAALRPLVRKFIEPKIVRTNVDSVIGSTGLVTEAIDNVSAKGQVKLGAMYWTARSADGQAISEGTLIRVERIEGVKVFVTLAEVPAQH